MTDSIKGDGEARKSGGGVEGPVAVETVLSHDDEVKKGHGANAALVDHEVAEYTSGPPVHIDDKTNTRLKKMIDRRVLVIMVVTYFLQSVDKGALGFASIMGLQEDTNLQGPEVRFFPRRRPGGGEEGRRRPCVLREDGSERQRELRRR